MCEGVCVCGCVCVCDGVCFCVCEGECVCVLRTMGRGVTNYPIQRNPTMMHIMYVNR